MRSILANLWENLQASLWFVPALIVVVTSTLAVVLLFIDQLSGDTLSRYAPWIFAGEADAARDLLSVIAGSLITVIAVAFSVVIVALQQAATQFSPRILDRFTRDRGNQVVFGVYIGTFTYALLVLRRVRTSSSEDPGFVPDISITFGMILALTSVALLVYFIHHMTHALRVTAIIQSIHEELDHEIARRFPDLLRKDGGEPPSAAELSRELAAELGPASHFASSRSGYLRRLDLRDLSHATRGARLVWVLPCVGDYVGEGEPLVRVWSDKPLAPRQHKYLERVFVLDEERTIRQDIRYGLRQIVDIALKALSPGINDPTTAEQCLDHLGDILGRLAQRALPSPLRRSDEGPHYLVDAPSFDEYVALALSQIRRIARPHAHVLAHLCRIIARVASRLPTPRRAGPFHHQLDEILAGLPGVGFTANDERFVREEVERARRALGAAHGP